MPKFTIGFHYDLNGYMEVDADNATEAEKKVFKILEQEGIEDVDVIDIIGREYGVTGERH